MNAGNCNPIPRISTEPSKKKESSVSPPQWSLPKKHYLSDSHIPTRVITCFECDTQNTIPQTALSAHCVRCGSYIKIDKVVLGPRSHRTITKTWGDVHVLANSFLDNYKIHCQNLLLEGKISGDFQCANRCIIKCDQHFHGKVSCHTLAIMKKVKVITSQPITTTNAHVFGNLQGDITATGTVIIHKTGQILGDITADRVEIE